MNDVLCKLYAFVVLVSLTGCAETNEKESNIIKGVLIEVNDDKYNLPWRLLKFEGGHVANINTGFRGEFFIGHYQEITVSEKGHFIHNKCESYDKLCAVFEDREYNHTDYAEHIATINGLEKKIETLESRIRDELAFVDPKDE